MPPNPMQFSAVIKKIPLCGLYAVNWKMTILIKLTPHCSWLY